MISTDSIDLIIDEIPLLDSFMRLPSNIMLVETCFNDSSLGPEELISLTEISDKQRSILLYPNPASEFITIESSNVQKVVLINTLGEVVYENESNSLKLTIDISNLPSGTYTILLYGNSPIKFIKL